MGYLLSQLIYRASPDSRDGKIVFTSQQQYMAKETNAETGNLRALKSFHLPCVPSFTLNSRYEDWL